jgi:hypothetical protein
VVERIMTKAMLAPAPNRKRKGAGKLATG